MSEMSLEEFMAEFRALLAKAIASGLDLDGFVTVGGPEIDPFMGGQRYTFSTNFKVNKNGDVLGE